MHDEKSGVRLRLDEPCTGDLEDETTTHMGLQICSFNIIQKNHINGVGKIELLFNYMHPWWFLCSFKKILCSLGPLNITATYL